MRTTIAVIALAFSSSAIAQNNAPVMDFVFDQPIYFDGNFADKTIVVTASDVDGDTLTFMESGRPPYCGFMQTSNTSFELQCSIFQDPMDPTPPPADVFATTVTVTDDGDPVMQDDQVFNIYLSNLPHEAPVLASIENQVANVNEQLVIDLSATDAVPNTLTFSTMNLPGFCMLNDNGDKTGDITCDPLPGDEDTYTITVTVTDDGTPWVVGTSPELLSDTQDFDLVVGSTNNAPVLDPIGNQEFTECCAIDINISASDMDGDTLTITSTPLPLDCDPITDNGDGTGNIHCDVLDMMGGLNFNVTVTVTDDGVPNLNDFETFSVSTNYVIPDEPPQANAGPDQSVLTGRLVQLDGSQSTDIEGAVDFDWQSISVPPGSAVNQLSLSDPTIDMPQFTPDVDGDYVFELTVTDSEMQTATDSVTISAFTPVQPVRLSLDVDQLHGADANGNEYVLTVDIPGEVITDGNAMASGFEGGPVYAAFELSGQVGSELVEVDPLTGTVQRIGNLGDFVSSMTFDTAGTLYAVTADIAVSPQTLYSVDTDTALMTFALTLGNAGGTPTEGDVIAFNPKDGFLYRTSFLGAMGLFPQFKYFDLSTGIDTTVQLSGGGTSDFEVTALVYDDETDQLFGYRRLTPSGNQSFSLALTGEISNVVNTGRRRGLTDWRPYPQKTDVTGFADASGDGIPDIATLVSNPGGQTEAQLYSGANGDNFGSLNFLNPDWRGIAIDTVDDANGDGTADDPGVAMLLIESATGKLLVQVRDATSGASVAKINFLNPDWKPIDVVVFNDTNGDGNPNDASIGVMAVDESTGKILIQVRNLSNGAKIATRSFLNSNYRAIAATSAPRAGQTPWLGVLGVEKATGKILVQTRQLSNGVLVDNAKFLSTDWTATDISAVMDGNSDGTADDPGWLVLANDNVSNATLIQARFAATGARIDNINYLTADYAGQRLATSPDISGNSREEASVYATRLSDDQRIIQVRDFQDATRTGNIFP